MKIFFYVMDLIGPQNACIGLGQELAKRNHQVGFFADPKYFDKYVKYGFQYLPLEDPMSKYETKVDETVGDTVMSMKETTKQFIEMGLFSDISTLKKVETLQNDSHLFEELYEYCLRMEPILKEMLKQEKPDLLILDGPCIPSCLLHSGIAWMTIFCSNPLGLFMSKDLPPFLSGFPTDSDRTQWEEFYKKAEEYRYDHVRKYQAKLDKVQGYPELKNHVFYPCSELLNLYQYPEELDYHDLIEIPANMQRVDAFCREEVEPFGLPAEFAAKMKPGDKLIFVSMGSLGTNDSRLMKKLVAALAKTPHFYIFSRGLCHDEWQLADNMIGDVYVPQTKILPMVDMAIIHGGNNTLTEALYFGKPVLVLPIFYDQYDNAQRVVEKGVGQRLETFRFTEEELLESVESILGDEKMHEKTKHIAEQIRKRNSKAKACERIEQAVKEFYDEKNVI